MPESEKQRRRHEEEVKMRALLMDHQKEGGKKKPRFNLWRTEGKPWVVQLSRPFSLPPPFFNFRKVFLVGWEESRLLSRENFSLQRVKMMERRTKNDFFLGKKNLVHVLGVFFSLEKARETKSWGGNAAGNKHRSLPACEPRREKKEKTIMSGF